MTNTMSQGKRLRPLMPKPNIDVQSPADIISSPPSPVPAAPHSSATAPSRGLSKVMESYERGGRTSFWGRGSSRWNPTPGQVRMLEEWYRRGLRTPTARQIQYMIYQLRFHGRIEGKNVFYWFQNHKARERQKLRRLFQMQMEMNITMSSLSSTSESQHHVSKGGDFYVQRIRKPLPFSSLVERDFLNLETPSPCTNEKQHHHRNNTETQMGGLVTSHGQEPVTLELFPVRSCSTLSPFQRQSTKDESHEVLNSNGMELQLFNRDSNSVPHSYFEFLAPS